MRYYLGEDSLCSQSALSTEKQMQCGQSAPSHMSEKKASFAFWPMRLSVTFCMQVVGKGISQSGQSARFYKDSSGQSGLPDHFFQCF